jgi:hypothetical protein
MVVEGVGVEEVVCLVEEGGGGEEVGEEKVAVLVKLDVAKKAISVRREEGGGKTRARKGRT